MSHLTPKAIRDQALIRVFYDLALRKAEVVGLDIEHFDVSAGTLFVPRRGCEDRFRLELPKRTVDALAAWIKERGERTGPIFVALDNRARGKRMTVNGVFWVIKRVVDDEAWG